MKCSLNCHKHSRRRQEAVDRIAAADTVVELWGMAVAVLVEAEAAGYILAPVGHIVVEVGRMAMVLAEDMAAVVDMAKAHHKIAALVEDMESGCPDVEGQLRPGMVDTHGRSWCEVEERFVKRKQQCRLGIQGYTRMGGVWMIRLCRGMTVERGGAV